MYAVALKHPNGVAARTFTSARALAPDAQWFRPLPATWQPATDINTWIRTLLGNPRGWRGWCIYNDQTERLGHEHSTKGHCKGVLVWTDRYITWLIHSVPEYPAAFDPRTSERVPDIPTPELIYGQSFAIYRTRYNTATLDAIGDQLHAMSPNIYLSMNFAITLAGIGHKETKTITLPAAPRWCSCMGANIHIEHFAKPPKHKVDIFHTIARTHDSRMKAMTWRRAPMADDDESVMAIRELHGADGKVYSTTHEHGKWAISATERACVVAVGDMNTMTSQLARGGGFMVVIGDVKLWRAFRALEVWHAMTDSPLV